MNSNPIGITFAEMMSGGFALGETDTATGAAKGANDILVMHGVITIDDIDRFIADPQHLGRLDVVMDWPTFGTGLPAPGGVFNLFSPTNDPALKLMVYEWGLQHQGKDYYFAGQKNVQVHPVLEIWNDTTTLHTQLHQGKDKTGPIVGAGIISSKLSRTPQDGYSIQATQCAIARSWPRRCDQVRKILHGRTLGHLHQESGSLTCPTTSSSSEAASAEPSPAVVSPKPATKSSSSSAAAAGTRPTILVALKTNGSGTATIPRRKTAGWSSTPFATWPSRKAQPSVEARSSTPTSPAKLPPPHSLRAGPQRSPTPKSSPSTIR